MKCIPSRVITLMADESIEVGLNGVAPNWGRGKSAFREISNVENRIVDTDMVNEKEGVNEVVYRQVRYLEDTIMSWNRYVDMWFR